MRTAVFQSPRDTLAVPPQHHRLIADIGSQRLAVRHLLAAREGPPNGPLCHGSGVLSHSDIDMRQFIGQADAMPPVAEALQISPSPPVLRPARRRGRPPIAAADAVSVDRLLDIAFHAFAQRGYEGTTLRELAKVLGVSHNLLNVRFGSKAGLWMRAVDARVARIAPPVFAAFDAPGLSDRQRCRELIHRFCHWAAENPDFVSLTHTEGRRATWRLDHLVDAYIRPFKDQFDALLSRVAATGPVRVISTTAVMALLVQGVGFYFASAPLLERIGAGDEISPAQRDRRLHPGRTARR
jgi:AcrR family transcriptional regulator